MNRAMTRIAACAWIAAVCWWADTAHGQALTQRVSVPIDRTAKHSRSAEIQVDFGARFDPGKPTVVVVEDGQQFYVRPGTMKALQDELFGPDVNVVGIIPRAANSAFVDATIAADGHINWLGAWRVFNSTEWIADIEAVRQALVGAHGTVDLYGRSGGAYLVHQYLNAHPAYVRRVFTQSAVDPVLNAALRIPLDDYVEKMTASDSALGADLARAMPKAGEARLRALVMLQRQHFYVPADSLRAAQRGLVDALVAGDSSALRRYDNQYEVPQILSLQQSHDAIAQNVRVLELLYPSGAFQNMRPGVIYPLLESQATFIRPLLDLVASGKISVPVRNAREAHRVAGDVFVLAACGDEAVDYRTSIALASEYPSHVLFIANDNHVFEAMDRLRVRAPLVRAFILAGPKSAAFAKAMKAADAVRWRPGAPEAK